MKSNGHAKAKRTLAEWWQTYMDHGPMVTPATAAIGMGLSKQRVHVLINQGRLPTVMVAGQRMVTLTAIGAFQAIPRSPHRPSMATRISVAYADRRRARKKSVDSGQ